MNNKMNTITNLVVLFGSVGVGTFLCNVLERTELNVWLARGIGALIAVAVCLICLLLLKRKRAKTDA